MNLWVKFLRVIPNWNLRFRLFHLEGILTLLYAYLIVRLMSFSAIEPFMNRNPTQPEIDGEMRRRIVQNVRWAIYQAMKVIPFEVVCFPRSLAAQIMLRRYGIYTTLYFGAVSTPEKGLTAHTWLQDKTTGIIDHEIAGYFNIVACYPLV